MHEPNDLVHHGPPVRYRRISHQGRINDLHRHLEPVYLPPEQSPIHPGRVGLLSGWQGLEMVMLGILALRRKSYLWMPCGFIQPLESICVLGY